MLAAWKTAEAEGLQHDPGAVQGDGPGRRGAGREARDSAPLYHRHERDLGAAAALAAAFGAACLTALLEHPRFRAAFDFLLLRCESGEVEAEIVQWWDRFKDAGEEERARMLMPEREGGKRRRRRRKPRTDDAGNEPATVQS